MTASAHTVQPNNQGERMQHTRRIYPYGLMGALGIADRDNRPLVFAG
ncbi:hypothetical protein [Sodalis-like endosymbiont of Proechinophthirus fluctus]|nr:hypothetical protein [Sodalis-like endosymbiont of Proechinophthirus fluctus]